MKKVFVTLHRAFPLGIMYWCENDDGTFELIDGQQRTISICKIINNEVTFNQYEDVNKRFNDLPECEKEQILDQELLIYVCSGDLSEKHEWFKTINIAGKSLTHQELRSAVYHGPFVSSAKVKFVSNASANAYANGAVDFINTPALRQDLLERVLWWHASYEGFSGSKDEKITKYLDKHRRDSDATDLYNYYKDVVAWARRTFGSKHEKEIKRVEWGILYNDYGNVEIDGVEDIRRKVDILMENPEIEKKSGIFEFVLNGNRKCLSTRTFKDSDKKAKYEEQKHICNRCGKEIPSISSAHADHIVPWSKGGKTDWSNLQILCVNCNLKKSAEDEAIDPFDHLN